ncbi:MAG TPA: alpha/beta hydrolase [Steroidobacteraceae bacterium]|nr:alpha/beta hydrolase [Steroidobacteraceae bacterium]
MSRDLRLLPVLSVAVLVAACGPRSAAPPGATPPVAAASPAATAAQAAEGPRIVMAGDGVHLEYRVYGHGDPAVLLVHGWACNETYWHSQLDALAARYTVVTLDLAGHGASGDNRHDWSIAAYAADVASVARQIPAAHLVLVGHGLGATVALAATPLIGTRVIGVVAVDALRSVGLPPIDAHGIERKLAPFRADFIGATRRLVSESLFEKGADAALVQKVAYDMSLRPPAVAVPTLEALLAFDLTGLTAGVHVPVYAINSDLAPTDAVRIRRFLPEFTLDVVPHSGHFLMLETPERFNPLLLKDLDALAARATR